MSEKHIEELIIRFIEGSCPDEEMRELLDWVRESTEHRDTLCGMKDIYDRSRLRERMTDEQIEAGWMRLVAECGIPEEEGRAAARTEEYYPQPVEERRTITPPRSGLWRRIGWSVVSTAACLAIFVTGYHLLRDERTEWITVANLTDNQRHLILPDGSAVWLNDGATLRYPQQFEKNGREVRLEGEAFFDIVRDETSPFVVRSKLLLVEVLGTRFNVDASDSKAQVVLESGSINLGRIENDRVVRQVMLQPGEAGQVYSSHDGIDVEQVDLMLYTSWKDYYLVIKSQCLGDVVRMLAKRYRTDIRIDDARIRNERFSGRFSQDQSLDEIFGVIDLMMPIDYRFDGESWIITAKN